ncbi:outer membrane lipoprotein LolB [Xylophilus rhododendri]|uniref:Outer-membrane lipoprotein LolB n=1 Tax=Xylophilus rhododendri TaxID=2697032 RepID=A0A857J8R1_9BURK|nr:outer membrane lipoprotein LolB [Xylophilus rhododendri]QHI99439.1 outer membrane lipoprotein LolB [Xylophilus rhododendri]
MRAVLRLGAAAACALALLSGCATPAANVAPTQGQAASAVPVERWNGRLALQVEDAPSQSFYAMFELQGNAGAGSLTLTTPIGNILAVLRWTADGASLERGGQSEPQRFASLDELAARATGTAIPVASLFDWLDGKPAAVPGWTADLSAQPQGRIVATRQQPLPVATLRVALDH